MDSNHVIDFGPLTQLAEKICTLAKGVSEGVKLKEFIEKYNEERISLICAALEQNNQRLCNNCFEPHDTKNFAYLYEENFKRTWRLFGEKHTLNSQSLFYLCDDCRNSYISFSGKPSVSGRTITYYYPAREKAKESFEVLRLGNWEDIPSRILPAKDIPSRILPAIINKRFISAGQLDTLPKSTIGQLAVKLGVKIPPKISSGCPLPEKPFFLWVGTEKLEF